MKKFLSLLCHKSLRLRLLNLLSIRLKSQKSFNNSIKISRRFFLFLEMLLVQTAKPRIHCSAFSQKRNETRNCCEMQNSEHLVSGATKFFWGFLRSKICVCGKFGWIFKRILCFVFDEFQCNFINTTKMVYLRFQWIKSLSSNCNKCKWASLNSSSFDDFEAKMRTKIIQTHTSHNIFIHRVITTKEITQVSLNCWLNEMKMNLKPERRELWNVEKAKKMNKNLRNFSSLPLLMDCVEFEKKKMNFEIVLGGSKMIFGHGSVN